MQYLPFSSINLKDPFFDSLKSDYSEFENWYNSKAAKNDQAYVLSDPSGIQGFLYLKTENEIVSDVNPPLDAKQRIKVGTLKVNPHGTRLGERFLKEIFDFATIHNAEEIYVTIFSKHTTLISLFKKYGFVSCGVKTTKNGTEDVLLKIIRKYKGDVCMHFPLIKKNDTGKYLLAIHPQYHSRLFPDSLLNSETYDIIQDVSHTNSIHKVYICFMDISVLRPKDNIVIYRTGDGAGPAYHRAVATSIGVVEEVRSKNDFIDLADYIQYCSSYSVFDVSELKDYFNAKKSHFFVLRMTYNAAFSKRVNRAKLLNEVGLDPNAYFGFLQLTNKQFDHILNLGQVSESIIID